ncbi:MAG: DMT family transporter [Actinomycetota bacterium]|nr:DMT family transporter [Actinomycetota bacterium]
MARGYVPLLLVVAAIWGASFMLIKVAVDEIEPIPMMALRLALAAIVLFALLLVQRGWRTARRDLRGGGLGVVLLGFANAALPFTLIAWGEQHIDSSIAAIANSPVPLFVALLAVKFRPSERVRGLRLVGIGLGFAGVAVLAGFNPEGGWWAVAGTLAVAGAALCYASSNLYTQVRLGGIDPLVIATGSSIAGALVLLPLSLFQIPDEVPSAEALGSVVVLGIVGTAIAYLFFYRMLAAYGASRAALVTYLIPPIALVYGIVLLDERLTAGALAGLVLTLVGVALASGLVGVPRRREVVPAAPHA